MASITIRDGIDKGFLPHLAHFFKEEVIDEWGESCLYLNNKLAEGYMKEIAFDNGAVLMRFNLTFKNDFSLHLIFGDKTYIDFIFILKGAVSLKLPNEEKAELNNFQNIIVQYPALLKNSYYFSANETVQFNIIRIETAQFIKKKNNNVEYLLKELKDVFLMQKPDSHYSHYGNLNLSIAEYYRQLDDIVQEGMIRCLIMEGFTHIIIGLHLHEHTNFINGNSVHDSISPADVEKLYEAKRIIHASLDEDIKVRDIAQKVDLHPSKLQLGFKILFFSNRKPIY